MKIAIDVTRGIVEGAGLGRYTLELVKNITSLDRDNEYLLFSTHYKSDEQKEEKIKEITKDGQLKFVNIPIPNKVKEKLWQLGIPYYKGALKGCNLLFAPTPFELNFGLKIPQVITVHDLIPCLFPEQLGIKRSKLLCAWGRRAVNHAKMVIADSEATKKDITSVYGTASTKIKVVHLGQKKFEKASGKLPSELSQRSYILAIGTVEPRKNLIGLFKAYAMLDEQTRAKYPIVLAGTKGSRSVEIMEMIDNLQLENNVKFLGYISDGELAKVYEDCLFFAFPSLYEGFGLPVLEAMSFGRAVLTSNVSSLPEVVGDAGIKIDPSNVDSIYKGLLKLIEDEKLRISMEKEAVRQAAKFSWEKAARETIEVFKKVMR